VDDVGGRTHGPAATAKDAGAAPEPARVHPLGAHR